jgi:hypothetical protein
MSFNGKIMENWPKDLISILETAKSDFEQFCNQITIAAETVAENLTQGMEDFVVEMENNFQQEVDDFLEEVDDFVLTLLQVPLEEEESEDRFFFDLDFSQETNFDFENPRVKPNAQQYSACVNCRNYHGQIYGGNLLVCAMHPYGWDGDSCPDWEELQIKS